jgi:hypothetical protein
LQWERDGAILVSQTPVPDWRANPKFTESDLVAYLKLIGPDNAFRALAVAFDCDDLHEIAQRILVEIERREANGADAGECN